MNSCASGITVNWPKEPPALTMPLTKLRFASGIQRAAAEMSSAGPIAPAPTAQTTPMSRISARDEVASGVAAVPTATISAPTSITGRGPQRSAIAPVTGCAMPHMSWPTAKARLIAA